MTPRAKSTEPDLFSQPGTAQPAAPAAKTGAKAKDWSFPGKVNWQEVTAGDRVHFVGIRNWMAAGLETETMDAVGEVKSKGITEDGASRHFIVVEILYNDSLPRLIPDRRTFVIE